MKKISINLCCILFTLLALTEQANAFYNQHSVLSTTEVDFFNETNNQPLKVKFWYQEDKTSCDAKVCLSSEQKPHQVAIISHGAFGSPREMNWLGYALASRGWLVAGIAHFGESWVYGTDKIDPSSVMRFWQRPQEIKFALDSMSQPGLFNRPVNTSKVVLLGHSSGGFTSLAMAGAKLNMEKSYRYCASALARADKGCDYGNQFKNKTLSEDALNQIEQQQLNMQDARVAAVIALDPALGHATTEQSLNSITIPALIVGSVDNDFLPYKEHAKKFADNIHNAKLVGITKGAGHFVYLDKCNMARKVKGVPLCKDREGVDRAEIQTQVVNHIFGFITHNSLD